jgi:UDP-N-acetylmuramoyl-L-alanyl-D-glutamate--2,6-diaminopimelate ligase
MKLHELLAEDAPDLDIAGITDDSRRVMPGYLFCAVRGHQSDGHDFIDEAIRKGAAAVVTERLAAPVALSPVPLLLKPDLGAMRGRMAARFYGEPSQKMRCIGVTGTNGKTSVAWHITNMLELMGQPAGYMGTIGWGRTSHLQASDSTTASAIINQERLAYLHDSGVQWVAMETSSHALDQRRVDAVTFAAGVFTNLTRDHLDYHRDMDAYGAAKARLFELPGLGHGVINSDDPFGRRLIEEFTGRIPLVTFGRKADVAFSHLRSGPTSIRGRWSTPWGKALFELPMVGEFSVSNAAAALATLGALGCNFESMVDVQRRLPAVPGRMQMYRIPEGPVVVIDYAHTPDALHVVLTALRQHCKHELVCVLGCGGDRDRGKRPLMTTAAEALADVVWLTSDNPRSEDPDHILEDMRSGLTGKACVYECVDRTDAIQRAIACSAAGDVILIAGKGHEEYQEFATGRVPYSDRRVVAEIIRQKAYD